MSNFVDELDRTSERSRFKITHSFLSVHRQPDFLVVEVNIPSALMEQMAILPKLPTVCRLLQRQCGLELGVHQPSISVEATFLLQDTVSGQYRTFTGSIQRMNRVYNLILPFETVSNLNQLENLVARAGDSTTIGNRLDSSVHFPNSRFQFAGVISLILNFQTRLPWNPAYYRHKKVFYSL